MERVPTDIGRPVVVVAGVKDEGAAFRFASAFAEAFEGPLELLAAVEADHYSDRTWELGERQGRRIFGPPEELSDPVLEAAEGQGWLLAVGAPAALLIQAALTIRITGGLSPLLWRPASRAFRSDLDLVDPRIGVAQGLAARLARSGLPDLPALG